MNDKYCRICGKALCGHPDSAERREAAREAFERKVEDLLKDDFGDDNPFQSYLIVCEEKSQVVTSKAALRDMLYHLSLKAWAHPVSVTRFNGVTL